MDAPSSHPAGSEIGGYQVVRELAPGRTWLARAAGGRDVVLKALEEDCLWKGQLHPNIKDRLGRVRELAHVGVANLYGVERAGALAYMVWAFVPGRTLDEYAAHGQRPARDVLSLMREVIIGVEVLHARGIVHGSIKASNVIVDERGERATLTHVSPLLYAEPREDVRALSAMLREVLEGRGEGQSPAGRLLDEAAAAGELSLRQLAGRLGGMIEARDGGSPDGAGGREAVGPRRRTLVAAAGVASLAIAIFAGMRIHAHQRAPKPPAPPEASPAQLEGSQDAGRTKALP